MRTQPGHYTSFLKRLSTAESHKLFKHLTAPRNILYTNSNKRSAARLLFGKGRPLIGAFNDKQVLKLAALYAQGIRADSPESDGYYNKARIDWLLKEHKYHNAFNYSYIVFYLLIARAISGHSGASRFLIITAFIIGVTIAIGQARSYFRRTRQRRAIK